MLPAELTPREVAGVLDQVYRAKNQGLPRRFSLTPERFKSLIGRARLRREFLDEVGDELQQREILMSYPRVPTRRLGFASNIVAETWQPASRDKVRQALTEKVSADWVESALKRLMRIYELNAGAHASRPPIIISEEELREVMDVSSFRKSWWLDLMEGLSKCTSSNKPAFFLFGATTKPGLAIIHKNHFDSWGQPTQAEWSAALKRHFLIES